MCRLTCRRVGHVIETNHTVKLELIETAGNYRIKFDQCSTQYMHVYQTYVSTLRT